MEVDYWDAPGGYVIASRDWYMIRKPNFTTTCGLLESTDMEMFPAIREMHGAQGDPARRTIPDALVRELRSSSAHLHRERSFERFKHCIGEISDILQPQGKRQ